MGGTDDCDTYFYVHTLAQAPGGKLGLLTPERVDLPGRRSGDGAAISPVSSKWLG
jgi:hypothetical protein